MGFAILYWNIKWKCFVVWNGKAKTDLSEFRLIQLMEAQSAEGSIQLEQLQAMGVQPLAHQEAREVGRQEEQGAYVPLVKHNQTRTEKRLFWRQIDVGARGEVWLRIGALRTIWPTLNLFIPKGGPTNRLRTARMSETWGFAPLLT